MVVTAAPRKEQENSLYAHTLGSFYLLDVQHNVMKWRTRKVRELFYIYYFTKKGPC